MAQRGDLDAGRTAFWMGFYLASRGATGRAAGWPGIAQWLLAGKPSCVEECYVLLVAACDQPFGAEYDGAYATATDAVTIEERFGGVGLAPSSEQAEGPPGSPGDWYGSSGPQRNPQWRYFTST